MSAGMAPERPVPFGMISSKFVSALGLNWSGPGLANLGPGRAQPWAANTQIGARGDPLRDYQILKRQTQCSRLRVVNRAPYAHTCGPNVAQKGGLTGSQVPLLWDEGEDGRLWVQGRGGQSSPSRDVPATAEGYVWSKGVALSSTHVTHP